MTFNRGQFKGAKLSTLKDEKKKADAKDKIFKGGRSDYHKVEDGDNIFRILPPHNPEKEPSWRPIRATWLECMVDEYNDKGEATGKKVRGNKRIFISTIHGKGEQKDRDIVETYIRFLCDQANDTIQDKEDRKKYLAPVYGYKDKKGKFVGGIMPSTSYVSYALDDAGKLGRLEVYKAVFEQIDRLNVEEDDEDGFLEIDVFANPDEGYPLKITKSKENNKTTVVVQKVLPKRKETMEEFYERTKVTDAQLKELSEKESLTELYVESYKRSDFEFALDGLKYFDEKNEFGIFENDDFLEELENISKLYPDESKKEETKKKKIVVEEDSDDDEPVKKAKSKPVVIEEEDDEEEEAPKPIKKVKKVVEEEPEEEQEEVKPKAKNKPKPVVIEEEDEDSDDEEDSEEDEELEAQIAKLRQRKK